MSEIENQSVKSLHMSYFGSELVCQNQSRLGYLQKPWNQLSTTEAIGTTFKHRCHLINWRGYWVSMEIISMHSEIKKIRIPITRSLWNTIIMCLQIILEGYWCFTYKFNQSANHEHSNLQWFYGICTNRSIGFFPSSSVNSRRELRNSFSLSLSWIFMDDE